MDQHPVKLDDIHIALSLLFRPSLQLTQILSLRFEKIFLIVVILECSSFFSTTNKLSTLLKIYYNRNITLSTSELALNSFVEHTNTSSVMPSTPRLLRTIDQLPEPTMPQRFTDTPPHLTYYALYFS